tara:strand:- start:5401 stop:5871 length:471 start_codon:yes stop_codon:yes gene_type:complete
MTELNTLRLVNAPATFLLPTGPLGSESGKFLARIPEKYRNKPAKVSVHQGSVTNLDNIFPAGTDTHILFVRSNLSTNSYDVTTQGNNLMLGTIIRPNQTEKVGSFDARSESYLGTVVLPPTIEIEVLGIVTATGQLTRLGEAASIIEIVLGLEFDM